MQCTTTIRIGTVLYIKNTLYLQNISYLSSEPSTLSRSSRVSYQSIVRSLAAMKAKSLLLPPSRAPRGTPSNFLKKKPSEILVVPSSRCYCYFHCSSSSSSSSSSLGSSRVRSAHPFFSLSVPLYPAAQLAHEAAQRSRRLYPKRSSRLGKTKRPFLFAPGYYYYYYNIRRLLPKKVVEEKEGGAAAPPSCFHLAQLKVSLQGGVRE